MTGYESGKIAEFCARMFLRLKGYVILSKNFKTGPKMNIGEVDFIAKHKKCIIFVEVKKRSSLEKAAYALSEKQQQRIIRGAQMYLKQHPQFKDFDLRFDVILISPPFYIRHLKNAWQCKGVN